MSKWLLLTFLILLALWLRYDPVVNGNLLEADGYYWKSLGEQSSDVKLGHAPNLLRVAPSGTREDFNLHPIITSHYSFANFYFYEGFLVAVLGLVAYYAGGFLLSGILLYAPIVVARTAIGWNDTDIYICIFSILILYNLYQKKYVMVGIFISCLALFWQSWFLFAGVSFMYWLLNDRRVVPILKLLLCLIPVTLYFFTPIIAAFAILPEVLGQMPTTGLATTAELQWSGIEKLKALASMEFILAVGLTYFMALRKKDWFVVLAIGCSVLLITKGERFLFLVIPILGVLICQYAKRLPNIILFAFLTGMMIHAIPTKSLHRYLLITNKAWDASMQYLKSTPSNSVIASWWSPGHIIACQSKRAVVLDGGSQHLARTFWVARALTTNNPAETKLILSYLATHGDRTINIMLSQNKSWSELLRYMVDKLSSVPPRPTYLLLYKEMLLNFPSIKQVAEGLGSLYPLPPVSDIYSTVYYRLFSGELDNELPPQYTYNDGKDCMKIWRIS